MTNEGNHGRPKSISIVIPCFNEGTVIREVLLEIMRQTKTLSDIRFEYIVIDDASRDDSAEMAGSVQGVKVLTNPCNKGYGYSLKRGIRQATGEYVLTMDADGQHDPNDILRFAERCVGYDLVAGNRLDSSGVPLIRRPGKRMLLGLLRVLTGDDIPDLNCGYRIFRREALLEHMHLFSNRFSFSMSSTMVLLADDCFVDFLPLRCRVRRGAPSQVKWTTALDTFLRMIRIIVLFHPLRIFLPLGAGFGALTLLSGFTDIFRGSLNLSTVLFAILCFLCLMFGLMADQNSYIQRKSQ